MQRDNNFIDKALSTPAKVDKARDFISAALDTKQPATQKFKKEGHSAPIDFTLGLAGGAYDFVKNLAQLSEKVVIPALPSDLKQLYTAYGFKPSELTSPTFVPNTMSGKLGEVVGETAASFAIPEARATEFALSTLPKVASTFLKAKPIRKAAFRGAVGGGLFGTVSSQENKTYMDIPLDIIAGAIAAPALNKILPWLLTSKASPANLIQQAKPVMAKAASDVREFFTKGEDIDTLKDRVFDIARSEYDNRKAAFKVYDDAVELGQKLLSDSGMQYDSSAINDAIQNAVKNMRSKLGLKAFTPSEIDAFENYLVNRYGTETRPIQNYNQALAQHQNINADQRELASDRFIDKGWKAKYEALEEVQNGITQSMKDSAAGNSIIADMIDTADKNYREFVKQYKNIFYDTTKSDEELKSKFLSAFIKKGAQNDQYELINRLFDILPDQNAKDMVTAWVLKEAKTPKDVLKIFNSFGEKQKELLFNRMKNELEKLNLVYNKHPEVFKEEIPLFDFIKPHLGLGALGGLGYFLHSPYLSGVSVVAGLGGNLLAKQLGKNQEFVRQVFEKKPEFKEFNKLRRAAVAGSQSLLDLLQGS